MIFHLKCINIYVNREPGYPGPRGDIGDTGAQGEPGSTVGFLIDIQGDTGIKGLPGDKGLIY